MGTRKYKPTSPGRRFQTASTFEELTKHEPEKSLVKSLKKSGGRNNTGRTTLRFRGGGHRKLYRIVDFHRSALLHYKDGEKRYILCPTGLKAGDTVVASEHADIKPGNAMPLLNIPDGTFVHNVEMRLGKGGQLARSAGVYIQLLTKESGYALLKMPSGEMRKVSERCYATIGQVGNLEHQSIKIGKAGRKRWLGRRPHVRGTAMNPVDHPHGGGEGRTKGGRHPVTPWGVPTKGYKTRKNRATDKYIVKRRK